MQDASMKGRIILSAALGFFFGLFSFIVMLLIPVDNAFGLAVFSGLGFYILMYVYLLLHEKYMSKKYADIEKAISSPVFYKTNGNFDLGGRIKNGNIYFCDAGIVFISMDEKPYAYDEILLEDIDHLEFDHIHLNIFACDGRIFVITLPDVSTIIDLLRDRGWIE